MLISGGSAGGLAAYIHADAIAARLPPSVRRLGAEPISGFFPLHAAADGRLTFAEQLRAACALHNCTAGTKGGARAKGRAGTKGGAARKARPARKAQAGGTA